MPGKHAKLGPSGSKRWLNCTASPLFVEELVASGAVMKDQESIYSIEGTEAHDWAAQTLDKEKPLPIDKVPENFRPHILEYQQVCLSCEHKAGKGSLRFVEEKVPLFYSPMENGTVDYAFIRMGKGGQPERLYIRDLKYGAGVPVDAEENTQLAIYAQSLITDLSSWWGSFPYNMVVDIGIHQPRYLGDDSLKTWEITVRELQEFCQPIADIAKLIFKAKSYTDLTFSPSAEVCQWCPAKGVCEARLKVTFADFPVDVIGLGVFENLDLPEVKTVTLETLSAIWRKRKDISKWLETADEYLTAIVLSGKEVPGIKMVQGRDGNRAWKDATQAEEQLLIPYLGEKAFQPKQILSPAQAEKLLSQQVETKILEKKMVTFTQRSTGKQVLAPVEDKREGVTPAIAHFSVLTDEEEKV